MFFHSSGVESITLSDGRDMIGIIRMVTDVRPNKRFQPTWLLGVAVAGVLLGLIAFRGGFA